MIAAARIRRLPQVVADAIAAGEVIERPASVVKELVENALDAGATRVDITIEGGGLVRIEVVDDGAGIAGDDLELAVERHATSKIGAASDIARSGTLGFRGEALASIAAVADLRIVTRTRDAASASMLRIRGGEVLERSPAASATGTRVEVGELFADAPARLRFLRSAAAESAAAVRIASELALAFPHVAFRCTLDGRAAFRTPGGTLRDASRAVLGARAEQSMVDVDAPGEIRISGVLAAPHAHRASRNGFVLIVNARRVHSRALLTAVDEAYRGLVPAGRHGFGVIAVEVDPDTLDVNVHPAKREVRFSDDRGVFAATQRACWAALRGAAALSGATASTMGLSLALPTTAALELRDGDMPIEVRGVPEAPGPAGKTVAPADGPLPPMTAVGQAGSAWLVAVAGDTVVLVDPHAAHEKILYTDLIERWSRDDTVAADSQLLLLPVVVDCGLQRAQQVAADRDFYSRCGISLEPFGPGLVRCLSIPAGAAGADPERLVAEMLDRIEDRGAGPDQRRHALAALVACHAAVRFGDRLDPTAQQRLLDRLSATPGGTRCPHGRPSVLLLDDPMLRRAFGRPPR